MKFQKGQKVKSTRNHEWQGNFLYIGEIATVDRNDESYGRGSLYVKNEKGEEVWIPHESYLEEVAEVELPPFLAESPDEISGERQKMEISEEEIEEENRNFRKAGGQSEEEADKEKVESLAEKLLIQHVSRMGLIGVEYSTLQGDVAEAAYSQAKEFMQILKEKRSGVL